MTDEQISQSTQNKLKAIQTLMAQLKMTVEAVDRVNQHGIIEKIVYYHDTEQYPKEAPKENLPTPDIRKEDDKASV